MFYLNKYTITNSEIVTVQYQTSKRSKLKLRGQMGSRSMSGPD